MVNVENRNIGDRLTPEWTYSVSGVETDPSQIVVLQQEPDGTESTVTTASTPSALTTASTPLARISAGVFRLSPGTSADEAGYWIFRAAATGTAESAAPDFVYKVLPSEFFSNATLGAHALVGLQETKDWLNERNIESGDELELAETIEAGLRCGDQRGRERVQHHHLHRHQAVLGRLRRVLERHRQDRRPRLAHLRPVPGQGRRHRHHRRSRRHHLPAQEPEAVGANHPTPVHLRRRQARQPTTGRSGVTGTWGFPAVPADIKRAVLDGVVAEIDRDVEHYTAGLGEATAGPGQNVVVFSGRPQLLDLPPESAGHRAPLPGSDRWLLRTGSCW